MNNSSSFSWEDILFGVSDSVFLVIMETLIICIILVAFIWLVPVFAVAFA